MVKKGSNIDKVAIILDFHNWLQGWIDYDLPWKEEKRLSKRGELMKS